MPLRSGLELFLSLLYSNNSEKIEGITRLMKLMFLLIKEGGFSQFEEELDFEPYFYGPWSSEIYLDYPETLKKFGVLKMEKKESLELDIDKTYCSDLIEANEKENIIFSLSKDGEKVAKTFFNRLNEIEKKEIEEMKLKWNKAPIDKLIEYVYIKHVKYTNKSKIKRDIFSKLKISPSLIKLIGIIPPINLKEEEEIIEKEIQKSYFE